MNSNGQAAVTGPVTTPTTLGSQTINSQAQSFIANLPAATTGPFDLAITMTDNTNPNSVAAGGTTTYTIVVSNNGPTAVVGAAVNDQLPALISSDVWTALASPDANVDTKSGKGSIVGDDVNLPVNATVTFTVVAQISPGADALYLVNSASVGTTVTTPGGVTDSNTANNTVTDTESISSALYPVLKMNPSAPANTPVFIGERRVYKGNRKSKKLVRFELRYDRALNAGTAQNTGNYAVYQLQKRKLKNVPVKSATYNAANFKHHAHACRIQDHRVCPCLYRWADRIQRLFRRGTQGSTLSLGDRQASGRCAYDRPWGLSHRSGRSESAELPECVDYFMSINQERDINVEIS